MLANICDITYTSVFKEQTPCELNIPHLSMLMTNLCRFKNGKYSAKLFNNAANAERPIRLPTTHLQCKAGA